MIHTSVKKRKKSSRDGRRPRKWSALYHPACWLIYNSRCLLDVCCQRLLNVCGSPSYKLSPQQIASYNTPFPNPTFVKSIPHLGYFPHLSQLKSLWSERKNPKRVYIKSSTFFQMFICITLGVSASPRHYVWQISALNMHSYSSN